MLDNPLSYQRAPDIGLYNDRVCSHGRSYDTGQVFVKDMKQMKWLDVRLLLGEQPQTRAWIDKTLVRHWQHIQSHDAYILPGDAMTSFFALLFLLQNSDKDVMVLDPRNHGLINYTRALQSLKTQCNPPFHEWLPKTNIRARGALTITTYVQTNACWKTLWNGNPGRHVGWSNAVTHAFCTYFLCQGCFALYPKSTLSSDFSVGFVQHPRWYWS